MQNAVTDKVSLVVFDWDGTVMDSIGRIVSSMQAAARHSDLVVPSDFAVKQIIGLSLDPALDVLFPGVTADKRLQLFTHYRDHYVIHDTTPTPLFDGVEQVLQQLKAQNVLLAVATGKARKGLQRMFDETGLAKYFDTSRCADEAQSKPHPDMLQQILLELDIKAEHAIMVGDTSHDMKMAQAIAMPRVGVTHGVHGRDVLSQFAPKAIIDTIPELLHVL
ncbi:phosphoglycolate phosphatase [Rheinheimera pacifica]|uniref:HAD-IA family hydrolase n=1 Tax=Rheinheimera pacifica TaxID=173990 RepID=UPI000CA81DD2|nr:HAD-IA family hydrolase [Rheinheimera pacifica]MDR6982640.1 phosphoglycolate phosphatase [Rheinheimera pacifica]PKM20316.1 MAG: HAD family hydrolase [Gammaproteobacteria bacterium HGW-Gammaproteobacteria-15]